MKKKIVEMALNGSGVRDTVRVLGVGINTVIRELKKSALIEKRSIGLTWMKKRKEIVLFK